MNDDDDLARVIGDGVRLTACPDCGRMLVAKSWWYAQDADTRRQVRAEYDLWPRYGSDRCERCCWRRRENRRIVPSTPAWLAVEEYQHRYDPRLSQRRNCEFIGPEIGMKPTTLERALLRAKRKGLM